ncbi:MAG: phosphoribosyltransferase family protein [Candidatus Parcubacteria bacterium]|nr:phosphoribosyltransferase family protein [Candidatus Parcubacteria bacterium]
MDNPAQANISDMTLRKNNVKDIFLIKDSSKIKNKNILLIDDVFTTGATLEEAAKILKETGAQSVAGLVIAKG